MAPDQNPQTGEGFIDAPTKAKVEYPADLPSAVDAVKAGRKAGVAYRTKDGRVWRLNHPSWRLDQRTTEELAAKEKPATSAQK